MQHIIRQEVISKVKKEEFCVCAGQQDFLLETNQPTYQ
jgi:hypothetical protein